VQAALQLREQMPTKRDPAAPWGRVLDVDEIRRPPKAPGDCLSKRSGLCGKFLRSGKVCVKHLDEYWARRLCSPVLCVGTCGHLLKRDPNSAWRLAQHLSHRVSNALCGAIRHPLMVSRDQQGLDDGHSGPERGVRPNVRVNADRGGRQRKPGLR
jgi:hypothetical protein